MVATLNGQKRPCVALTANHQRKIVRVLSRSLPSRGQKSVEVCRKLLEHDLFTNSASSYLVNFLVSANSVDGLLTLMERISDLQESCLVKILSFALVAENGTKPPVMNPDRISIILRLLRYSYSPSSLTQEMKPFSPEQVMSLLRVLNCLFTQLLFSHDASEAGPSLSQVVDFLNCLLDSSSKSITSVPEFEEEINYASTLVDCSEKSLSILAESEQRRSSSSSSFHSARRKDYSIQIVVFNT